MRWIADTNRASWQRAALLRGAEVAWLGASMPGAPRPTGRRGGASSAALPCPTCPGGRAGPGGAYAYSKPEDFIVASGGRAAGRGGARSVRLNREPAELLALAAGADALGPRVATLLERVVWPGKPGEASTIPALTDEEQRRYDAGREVYRNICQACHQPDGRGQDRLAPGLVGLAAGACGRRHHDADSAERQRGLVRIDAAGWFDTQRRTDRQRVDLHSSRVGPGRYACRSRDGEVRAGVDLWPDAAVDDGGIDVDGSEEPVIPAISSRRRTA